MLKGKLPFIFRYEIREPDTIKNIDLTGVPRVTRSILVEIVSTLGAAWQATIFPSHIILYKERRRYRHGEAISGKAR